LFCSGFGVPFVSGLFEVADGVSMVNGIIFGTSASSKAVFESFVDPCATRLGLK